MSMRRDFHASEKGLRCKASFAARVETCVRYKLSKLMRDSVRQTGYRADEGVCGKGELLRRLRATVLLRFVRRLPRLRDLGYNKENVGGGGNPPNAIRAGKPV